MSRQRVRILGSPPRSGSPLAGKPLAGMSGSWERLGVHLMNQPFFLPMVEKAGATAAPKNVGVARPTCIACRACGEPVWVLRGDHAEPFTLTSAAYTGGKAEPVAWAPETVYPACVKPAFTEPAGAEGDPSEHSHLKCPFCGDNLKLSAPPRAGKPRKAASTDE